MTNLRRAAKRAILDLLEDRRAWVRLEAARLALSLPPGNAAPSLASSVLVAKLVNEGDLSVRFGEAIKNAPEVVTVADLAAFGETRLLGLKNMGRIGVKAAQRMCRRAGLELVP